VGSFKHFVCLIIIIIWTWIRIPNVQSFLHTRTKNNCEQESLQKCFDHLDAKQKHNYTHISACMPIYRDTLNYRLINWVININSHLDGVQFYNILWRALDVKWGCNFRGAIIWDKTEAGLMLEMKMLFFKDRSVH